jgi:L-lactate dehydrogenase
VRPSKQPTPINFIDRAGDYPDLADAVLTIVTAGINEQAGGATDRSDPAGRLKLLDANAEVYRDIIPRIVAVAPQAVILVITDPPDPLADLARRLAGHERVLSSGTFLDTLRFRFHLARRLEVSPAFVEAQVVGEHGTSQVFLWSSARVAGMLAIAALGRHGESSDEFRRQVEDEVRYANITIIEGTGASQLGIGWLRRRSSRRSCATSRRSYRSALSIRNTGPRCRCRACSAAPA